jgi:hypothetical protein
VNQAQVIWCSSLPSLAKLNLTHTEGTSQASCLLLPGKACEVTPFYRSWWSFLHRCTSHRNIFVMCHELAGFLYKHSNEPALALPPTRQNLYSLIYWRERRWWHWAVRYNAVLIHLGGQVTILVLSFWCLSSKSGVLKFRCDVQFLVWHANKKSHFIASCQKCWHHVRAMVDCQKISLANQIAALVWRAMLHPRLRMTVNWCQWISLLFCPGRSSSCQVEAVTEATEATEKRSSHRSHWEKQSPTDKAIVELPWIPQWHWDQWWPLLQRVFS